MRNEKGTTYGILCIILIRREKLNILIKYKFVYIPSLEKRSHNLFFHYIHSLYPYEHYLLCELSRYEIIPSYLMTTSGRSEKALHLYIRHKFHKKKSNKKKYSDI